MPIIGAVVGAILTGLLYWLLWGRGLEYIDHRLNERSTRKRDAVRRREATAQKAMAPLRSITDPRDAATVLMIVVARQRGVPTPEQIQAIESEMAVVLGLGAEVQGRFAFARFAAEQVSAPENAVDELAKLFRTALNAAEHRDLVGMLRRVAELHGGPMPEQERVIGLTERRLAA